MRDARTGRVDRERLVLDTSAVLTLIEDEAGADRVVQALKEAEVLLPAVVLMEAYYISLQERGAEEADGRHALLKELDLQILWSLDEAVIRTAARFKTTRRISLADAIVAAYAAQRNATLLHKDPEFEALEGVVRLEALPYKKRRAKKGQGAT